MWRKTSIAALVLAIGLLAGSASPARAEYGSGLSYHKQRTGFGYSKHWGHGRGYPKSGFSYHSPYRKYSAYSGHRVHPRYGYPPRPYGYRPHYHGHRHSY